MQHGKHDVEEKVHDMTDKVSEKIHDASEKIDEYKEKLQDASEKVIKNVKARPVLSLGIAAACGWLIGKIFK